MTDPRDREEALAEALEDLHRRRGRGEEATADDYRDRLGESHGDFVKIVDAEIRLDGTLAPAPAEALPRPFASFTLLREIGRGASGVVYEAVDRRLGRTVALKVLRTGVDTDAAALERFRREAKACAHVRHDHIVAIHEAGETDGRPWYSMDLVPGEALAAKVRGGERIDPRVLAEGIAGIADGLDALHRAGIVHRDVKPQNLILRPDGRMVLADFGLARSAQAVSLTQTGDALGTPLYMSPEQMLGQRSEVDARTDVYGLGATMYEALAGRPVFAAEDVATLMRLILTQRPEPLRAVAGGVPADLEAVVMKCLEKRKDDRYASAAALADDLRAFAAGRPVVGRPVGAGMRVLRGARRRWPALALAACAVLAAGAWWWLRPARLHYSSILDVPFAVFLDGEKQGTTPTTVSIGRGSHVVRIEHEWFEPQESVVRAAGGEDVWPRLQPLVARAKHAGDVREFVRKLTGVLTAPPQEPPALPAERPLVPTLPVELYAPRGDVRASDVVALVASVGEAHGRLRVLRGDETLWEYTPGKSGEYWIPVPAEVRARLHVGDVVRWGWFPKEGSFESGKPTTAEFRVVDRTLAADAPELAALLQTADGTAHRVQALREAKLPTAAFLAAYAGIEARPADRASWTPFLWALVDLQGSDTQLYAQIADWIHGKNPHPPLLRVPPK